ncbi:MAG: 50S ribosomal protein L30 [Armatimonadota bacterium]
MPKVLKITLVKSVYGNVPKNRATCHALGLRKIGQSTLNHPTPPILGMIHQVKHLLKVEEVEHEGELKTLRRRDPRKKAATAEKPAKAAKAEAPKAEAKPKATKKKSEEKV